MAKSIYIDYELMEQYAVDYQNASQQIEDLLASLRTTQANVSEIWQGDAFDSFDDQFNQLVPKVQEFAGLMDEIHTQMVQISNVYRDAESANTLR